MNEFFKNKPIGNFLEIGANDGNPYQDTEPCWGLVETGWSGVYVEPNPFGCSRLIENLKPFGLDKFKILNCAVDKRIQIIKFHISQTHPAVSSIYENWTDNLGIRTDFDKFAIWLNTITFDQIFMTFGTDFNFISLDLECSDKILEYHIQSIDWQNFKNLELICIEIVNYKFIEKYLKSSGFIYLTKGNDNNVFFKKIG